MRTKITTVYLFDELSDEAKQTAIDGTRSLNVQDFEWWDSSYESFAEAAGLFGLDIRQTRKSFVGAGNCYGSCHLFLWLLLARRWCMF